MGVQPGRACYYQPDLQPTQEEIMSDHTEEYLDLQTRQSIIASYQEGS